MAVAKSKKRKTPVKIKREQVAKLLRDQLTQECLLLRKKGLSQRAIAETLIETHRESDPKFKISQRTVSEYLQAALAELAQQNLAEADQLRTLELSRLEYLLESLAPGIDTGDVSAINAAVRVSESRRKLLGIDAPEKVNNDVVMRVIYGNDGETGNQNSST